MHSYKSRYTGEQVDSLLGEVPKLSRKIAESLNEGGYVNEFLKNNQQDWNQNDETKIDYIKNRPFYDSTEIVCDLKNILPGETQKRAYENYVPQIGDTLVFIVECDGETSSKEVTISQFPTLVNDNFDACKLYSDGFVVSTIESAGISIRVEKPGELVKLDEKFIPDSIARTSEVKQLESVAKGAARSRVYKTYKEMAEAFATMTADDVRVGDHIYIEQLSVPDLWISKVYEAQLEGYYYYDTDELLVSVLGGAGSVPVNTPWFEVSMLETQKADLSGFVTEEEMDKTVGEIDTALEEIIVLQEELLVPNGDEVDY